MPFAGYRDFDECVAKNRDKSDPEAYCASIMRQVEGSNMVAAGVAAYRDGDWVRARPFGWADAGLHENVVYGSESRAPVTGMLTIVKSDLTGVWRHAVNGVTVDPATITVIEPPGE